MHISANCVSSFSFSGAQNTARRVRTCAEQLCTGALRSTRYRLTCSVNVA